MISKSIDLLPFLGAGLGYRYQIHNDILANEDEIDFLEIITEKYIGTSPRSIDALTEMAEKFTIIPHGVSLSVGSARKVSKTFLSNVKDVVDILNAPYYSDHLATTECPGIDLGHLSPIQYNDVTLKYTVDNINMVQDTLGIPFVIENITKTLEIPGSTMSEEDFLHQLVDKTGCGMLLDVTNLYTNSVNFGFDAIERAKQLPLDAVVQAHLAGGVWHNGKLIDSHSESIPNQVWQLFEELIPLMPIKGALVERDDNYPDFDELLAEVKKGKKLLSNTSSK
ncbi:MULTISPECIES: DUF692 domain-containing protein [Pseudoalteromonas]|uniref:DUF692 family protein n=1 Tax=Pseudoalteromonas rubra TaxID=43658 RepID=A0A5S3UY07_9GAMM|nr:MULTISPECIES: DUF692 domain-containing protein [Pseudoalteromonas]MCG7563691.1 DUF692 domain-containing protein [Pseudoalteromonas sp. McH1-42]MEC4090310.1 DUF692 domain-containing protein [Pseudoalteromonas rubra]QPB85032.1 DUF692 family protein [Pseudoalteromonas rubra]